MTLGIVARSQLQALLTTGKVLYYEGGEPEPADTIVVDKLQRFSDPLATLRRLMDAGPEHLILAGLAVTTRARVEFKDASGSYVFPNLDEFRAALSEFYAVLASHNDDSGVIAVPGARLHGACVIARRR